MAIIISSVVGAVLIVIVSAYCISNSNCRRSRSDESDSQDVEASHSPDYLPNSDAIDVASVASPPPYGDVTKEAPQHMVCPISLSVMKEPCRCVDGHHNFERSYLLRHLRKNTPACPVSRIPMTMSDVVPNEELKAEIREWLGEDLPPGSPVSVSAPEQRTPASP